MSLAGKTIFMTGGSRGIGLAIGGDYMIPRSMPPLPPGVSLKALRPA